MKVITPHIPVLFNEIIDTFKNCDEGYIIDCTTGFGGHSEGLLNNNNNIKLICNDQDNEALEFSKKRLSPFKDKIIFHKGNFKNVISKHKDYKISGILADIGVSSLQLDNDNRGFGFNSESLDMRMDQSQRLNARDVVNNYSQIMLEKIFKEYGEIKEYKKIASLIIENRPFKNAKQLSSLLLQKMYKTKMHPATLIFQAIRIEVNNELDVLKNLFDSIEKYNLSNCIVALISFHSLEDRIVKNYFKKWTKKCICPVCIDKCECGANHQKGKIITKKPITPTSDETRQNPRSRSSKLRIFKFD
ncbi:rRNA small subunit methyltransferase H [hydrothermal vent metagenome]|uniref:rRNA small subunit methyltransferase H n=1 Tax=hydrothermal vent metagenome TaxID=652676 RepID=A0A3B1E7L7_9ZZZZ